MSELETRLQELEARALDALNQAADGAQLEEVRRSLFGKKSELTQILRGMGALPADERPRVGQAVNATRDRLDEAFAAQQSQIERAEMDARLSAEKIDVTAPAAADQLWPPPPDNADDGRYYSHLLQPRL